MSTPLLTTKLHIPSPRPQAVARPRLIERLDAGLHGKLTLISAPAGFGKTTLVSEWIVAQGHLAHPTAWLSLDEADREPVRFLTYLVAALRTIDADLGEGVLRVLRSPQPPPIESILTTLLNELAALPGRSILVLDDYHVLDAHAIDAALAFLLDHLPAQVHVVIATREDPNLPLARLRARGQLTELRAADLRFTPAEAAGFLNQVMGLELSPSDIAALETRTEGWIAGLQLAALSMQGNQDVAGFIKSFTGSHHFVLDYLVEEVLYRQPAAVQTFLLRTSILDHLCGPLCDALLCAPAGAGQTMLETIHQANLFVVPLDNERRWYRYHHLFADLLRQRLQQGDSEPTADAGQDGRAPAVTPAVLYQRASAWYEANGLAVEAFRHAAAAHDVARAARLVEGEGMPLHFRGAVDPVLTWLASLPAAELDARPALWVMYASALSIAGQNSSVEEKLQAAEAALQGAAPDAHTQNLVGHIASIRAMLAATQYQVEASIAQARRALAHLHPDNLAVRTAATWTLGLAYQFQGDRAAAGQTFAEAIAICQASGNTFVEILATTGLGYIQEIENQLGLAAETYRRVLALSGDPPLPAACEALLGLGRILYQWNDLDAAEAHAAQGATLARQIETIDSFVACEVLLARVKLARGDEAGAASLLAETTQSVRRHNFVTQAPEVAAAQVLVLLRQGDTAAAGELAQKHELPMSRARVYLAQGDPAAALALLAPLCKEMEAKAWADERLRVRVQAAIAYHAQGETEAALQVLGDALAAAEPEGHIRLFLDEGASMAALLVDAAAHGIRPAYVQTLLAAFEAAQPADAAPIPPVHILPASQPLVEPLSPREIEVLQLTAQGLSNREIGERLYLALSTVKGHNRNIFGKLQVQRRTEAIARARELGLL